jgi:hypothetical protein
MAYAEVEPFGEDRADLRSGIVAATVYNLNRGRGMPSMKPVDFIPRFERRRQTAEEMAQRLDLLTAMTKPPGAGG